MSEPPTRPAHFGDHQIGIYLQGMFADTKPSITTNLAELEQRAAESLSAEAVGYIVASAGSGATARANRAAFDAWQIVPNMLRDVAARDLSCTVLGTRMPAPIMLAPVGVQTLAHPDGELASARAAAALACPTSTPPRPHMTSNRSLKRMATEHVGISCTGPPIRTCA